MTLLMSQLDEDDVMMIACMKNASHVIIGLMRKVGSQTSIKMEAEITVFYNNKLGTFTRI